ncbi:dolichyl-phosphate beta-glucosyltransferase, partial [Pichia californica]
LYTIIWSFSHKPRLPFKSELTYHTNDKENKSYKLPKFNSEIPEDEKVFLSIVIPCFNETTRLKVMLQEAISYLENQTDNIKLQKSFEILIVDDGSKDKTAEYAIELANEFKLSPHCLRVIKFEKNRGKGGAVTHGMQCARGDYIIFADADGASQFSDIIKLLNSIQKLDDKKPLENPAVSIGSRAHMVNTDAVVKRALIRNILMYCLHTLVFIFGIRDIKDTQCGFKLFNKSAVELIFPNMHTEGWIFDVELLILVSRQNIPLEEIPINWHEVDGSKMVLARDSVNMAIDLVVTRMAYILGIYKEKQKEKQV